MTFKEFVIQFIITFVVAFIASVVAIFLYNLIIHGMVKFTWGISVMLAFTIGVATPLSSLFKSKK